LYAPLRKEDLVVGLETFLVNELLMFGTIYRVTLLILLVLMLLNVVYRTCRFQFVSPVQLLVFSRPIVIRLLLVHFSAF